MNLIAERVDVWAATIPDKPGSLSNVLTGLREVGADLHFILSRRESGGTATVYVTPLVGDAELGAAATLGFNLTARVHSVRVQGENRPGVVADLTTRLAEAGVNLRGLSAARYGTQFMLYIGLDSAEDADKALATLQKT